jgi:hypothetical protein
MKHCLIDFDGVILRRHPVHGAVALRCSQYVALKTRLPIRRAELLNREMYESCGHTMLGLARLGVPCSVAEFDTFVYGDLDYDAAFGGICDTHAEDIHALRRLLVACADLGFSPAVLSNAPAAYCREVLGRMAALTAHQGLEIDALRSNVLRPRALKPTELAYDALDAELYGAASPSARIVLVDDKLANLLPACARPNWIPILFSPAPPEDGDLMSFPCLPGASVGHLSEHAVGVGGGGGCALAIAPSLDCVAACLRAASSQSSLARNAEASFTTY